MPEQIAPHEGRELELVLTGVKPFAVVEMKKDPKQFDKITSCPLLLRRFITSPEGMEVWFTTLDGQHFMNVYESLINNSKKLTAKFGTAWYQREMGRLFGYSEEEIDAFVNGDVKCNCSKCRGMSYEPE